MFYAWTRWVDPERQEPALSCFRAYFPTWLVTAQLPDRRIRDYGVLCIAHFFNQDHGGSLFELHSQKQLLCAS